MAYLIAIDQGTTNSRVIIFDQSARLIAYQQKPLSLSYPQNGWVEQNPQEILDNTIACLQQAVRKANISPQQIVACGIANQRETTILWDKKTGQAIYPAIVWQDRRTATECAALAKTDLAAYVQTATGMRIDPYFSASKIRWILDNKPIARELAARHELCFGTVDSFLLWHLTDNKKHVTDATNAARTLLFNIHTQQWDAKLLAAFAIPAHILPEVYDNTADFGVIRSELLGAAIPIAAMIGDQQSALVGQAALGVGDAKATYGTGGFVVVNTGENCLTSKHQLLSTIAYRLANKVTYALEGSIYSAGSIVKWLQNKLQLIATPADSETCARQVDTMDGVYLVPAFTGLAAPYWDANARAAILGMTTNTNRQQIVRAALESVAYQSQDLFAAIANDGANLASLRVDGGMTANAWFLQFLADIVAKPIERPVCTETTALGAALLAGLQIGVYASLDDIRKDWQCEQIFKPQMNAQERTRLYQGWQEAVERCLVK